MTDAPENYTERRALIAQKLEPYFGVSSMVPTNMSATFEPEFVENSLMCSWADPITLTDRTLFVYLSRVEDGSTTASDVRDMIEEETLPTPPGQPPEAYEVPGQDSGEYVFVLTYLGRLTAIGGNCMVSIMPSGFPVPLADIAGVALDIARTVGCSAYVDDLQPPILDTGKVSGVWSTADRWTYDPRTPPNG